jgi:hypothetical protein
VSVSREREGGFVEGATQNRKCITRNTPRHSGQLGWVKGKAAGGGLVGHRGGLGRLGLTPGKIQGNIDFRISNGF